MALNFGAGLQALANFGTGYMQEGRNEQQDAYNKVATQSAQLDLQQRQLQAQQQQQMSDDAIKTSIQQQQQAPKPGQPPQQAPQQQVDPMQQMQTMYQHAMSRGDTVGAGRLLAQMSNYGTAQMAQQQKQAAIQSATLKSSIQGIQYVSQLFNGVTDQQTYSQAKMQAMSNPSLPEEERQNLAKLPDQYSPALVAHLVNSGMSAASTKTQQLHQMEFQSQQQHRAFQETMSAQHEKLYAAKTSAEINHMQTQKKAGATSQAPTTTMLKEIAPIAADVLKVSQSDPNLMGPNSTAPAPGSNAAPKIDYNTPALIGIASHTKQLMASGMPFETAARQATEQAVKDGQLQQSDLKDGKKSYSYHSAIRGDSEGNPIPLQGLQKQHLVEGKWYTLDGHTEQYRAPK